MYIDLVYIEKPADDERIWKYMDFAKFVSMLYTRKLHFTRVDTLEDPFEGSFPKGNVKRRLKTYLAKLDKEEIKTVSETYKEFIKQTFVNCWHINQYQSTAMWKLYLQSNEGIAIRSTFGRLKKSLDKRNKHEVYIGKIKYIRYAKDVIPESTLYPYFYKRVSFAHEQELRAVVQQFSPHSEDAEYKYPNESGINIPVNLDILIERIILAPNCPSWQKLVIKSILEKYELDKEVRRSTLYVRDKRIVY